MIGQNGGPMQLKGYWSVIDSREGDDWKIRMLTWNMTPPAAAACSGEIDQKRRVAYVPEGGA
jgi:hypothetical protein